MAHFNIILMYASVLQWPTMLLTRTIYRLFYPYACYMFLYETLPICHRKSNIGLTKRSNSQLGDQGIHWTVKLKEVSEKSRLKG
jgi:hypothetical protein